MGESFFYLALVWPLVVYIALPASISLTLRPISSRASDTCTPRYTVPWAVTGNLQQPRIWPILGYGSTRERCSEGAESLVFGQSRAFGSICSKSPPPRILGVASKLSMLSCQPCRERQTPPRLAFVFTVRERKRGHHPESKRGETSMRILSH